MAQTHNAQWLFNTLLATDGTERCRLLIPDTILVEHGSFSRWLFTSKTGEVVKKRSMDVSLIADRLAKVSLDDLHNTRRFVAVSRAEDGSVEFIEERDLLSYLGKASGAAVQAFVHAKGGNDTVYRNGYRVANDKGKVITSTHKLVQWGQGSGAVTPGVPTQNPMVRSTAARLNEELDEITRYVVRFVESHKKLRIIHMDVDYTIDSEGQPWFSWVSGLETASGEAALDLSLAGLPVEGPPPGAMGGPPGRPPRRRRSPSPIRVPTPPDRATDPDNLKALDLQMSVASRNLDAGMEGSFRDGPQSHMMMDPSSISALSVSSSMSSLPRRDKEQVRRGPAMCGRQPPVGRAL